MNTTPSTSHAPRPDPNAADYLLAYSWLVSALLLLGAASRTSADDKAVGELAGIGRKLSAASSSAQLLAKRLGPAAVGKNTTAVLEFVRGQGQITCRTSFEIHSNLAFLKAKYRGTHPQDREQIFQRACTYELAFAPKTQQWRFVREVSGRELSTLRMGASSNLRRQLAQRKVAGVAHALGLVPDKNTTSAKARDALAKAGLGVVVKCFEKRERASLVPVPDSSPSCFAMVFRKRLRGKWKTENVKYVFLMAARTEAGLAMSFRARIPRTQPYVRVQTFMEAFSMMDDAILLPAKESGDQLRFLRKKDTPVPEALKSAMAKQAPPDSKGVCRFIPLCQRANMSWVEIHNVVEQHSPVVPVKALPAFVKLQEEWRNCGDRDTQKQLLYRNLTIPAMAPLHPAFVSWLYSVGADFFEFDNSDVKRWKELLGAPWSRDQCKEGFGQTCERSVAEFRQS